MKRKTILDSIDVPKPCSASWEEMTGDEKVRFCSSCEKDIYNLSAMSRQKAEKLVEDSSGKICVRYEKNSQGKIVTAPPKFTQITRRATIAAGVLATTLSLSAMNYAQGEWFPREQKEEVSSKEKNSKQGLATISGTISDQYGAVIPGTKITLLDKKTNKSRMIRSGNEGEYEFKNLDPSTYDIEVETEYFEKVHQQNIEVTKDSKLLKNFSLKPNGNTEVVGLIIIEPTIEIEEIKLPHPQIEQRKMESLPISKNINKVFLGLIVPAKEEKKKKKKQ